MKKNKTISIVIDEEMEKIIEELGTKILLTDNRSHIIRYALKFTHKKMIGDSNA